MHSAIYFTDDNLLHPTRVDIRRRTSVASRCIIAKGVISRPVNSQTLSVGRIFEAVSLEVPERLE